MLERTTRERTAQDRRANGAPMVTAPDVALLQLQRAAGNHAVTQTLSASAPPRG